MDQELSDLIQGIREGNSDAFTDFYKKCAPYVQIYLYKAGMQQKHHQDLEIVMQEVFLRIGRAIIRNEYAAEGALFKYIQMTARSCAFDYFDGLRKDSALCPLEEECEDAFYSNVSNQHENLERKEQEEHRQRVLREIENALPPDDYKILTLVLDGLKHEDIKVILNLQTISAVKMRVKRAIEKAKEIRKTFFSDRGL